MKQGADGWTLIQSGSISYSGGVPVLTAFVSTNSVKLRHKKTGQKVKLGLIAAKMSVRTSNTKRTTLSAETLARTRHSFERSKEHWTHRPCSEIKYQQKNHWGEVLNFFLYEDHKQFLLFARLSCYFTPYNRLTDYSLEVHKLTKSPTLLSFWPAGSIPPPND